MFRILILISIFTMLVDTIMSGYVLVTGRTEEEYAFLDSKYGEFDPEVMAELGMKPGTGNWLGDLACIFTHISMAAAPVVLALLVNCEDVNLMAMAILYMVVATPAIYYKIRGSLRWDHDEKVYANFGEYLMISWFCFFKAVFLLLLYVTMFAAISVG